MCEVPNSMNAVENNIDEPEPECIYRCGWCGYPVDKEGKYLEFINDPDEASEYLQKNTESEVVNVNGECCPNGDEEHAQQDYRDQEF